MSKTIYTFLAVAVLAACAATPYEPENERQKRAEKFAQWWRAN
ncbi:Membrane lipoprotein, lipid attachment site [Comamonadaceae bacterium]